MKTKQFQYNCLSNSYEIKVLLLYAFLIVNLFNFTFYELISQKSLNKLYTWFGAV